MHPETMQVCDFTVAQLIAVHNPSQPLQVFSHETFQKFMCNILSRLLCVNYYHQISQTHQVGSAWVFKYSPPVSLSITEVVLSNTVIHNCQVLILPPAMTMIIC